MYIIFAADEQVGSETAIEAAVAVADKAAQASPRSADVEFVVVQAGGGEVYHTRSCGLEEDGLPLDLQDWAPGEVTEAYGR